MCEIKQVELPTQSESKEAKKEISSNLSRSHQVIQVQGYINQRE